MERNVAYFSMEIALDAAMPTYSGGLGVLAGDTVRAAADMGIGLVAVSLLHREGYFHQRLDAAGNQSEEPVHWSPDDFLEELDTRVSVRVRGRDVRIRVWRYDVEGSSGRVPVYLLDTDVAENDADLRALTHWLYGGDSAYRLAQEVVLGIGGVRVLDALGYTAINRFHMNEGHSSLLTLELLARSAAADGRSTIEDRDVDDVRRKCVFTTHTPVSAGHDQFPMAMVEETVGPHPALARRDLFSHDGLFNMTYAALNLSHFVNGVAKRHGLVTQHIFGRRVVDSITNGVHARTWTSQPFRALFDRYVPGWAEDNFGLRNALAIPGGELWNAHVEQKTELVRAVNRTANAGFDVDTLTLGYARRMTAYKRPDLLFSDPAALRKISKNEGPIQIVYAGKAHPRDHDGKQLIRRIFELERSVGDGVRFAFLPNYDMELAKLLTSGVDVWLNTPEPPLEASGTSGMKAALNGVPSLSILDGWWLEGCIEGLTGWSIGADSWGLGTRPDGHLDSESLYQKLGEVVAPLYYGDREGFIEVMRHAIALNGSFFNAQRMLQQYAVKAYYL